MAFSSFPFIRKMWWKALLKKETKKEMIRIRIFALVSLGAQISAPKDGPKGLLRLRVPPASWLKRSGDKDEKEIIKDFSPGWFSIEPARE
jgi:hypothetical protein